VHAVNRFAGSDAVGPRAHPFRVAERWELPSNHPQRFLKNVFSHIGVADDGSDVLEEGILQQAEQAIERLSVAGLCPRDEEQLVRAFRQGALIDSSAIRTRPTEREM
jgi:hypothetical protein